MTDNRVEAFVESILADRSPKQFSASPEDTDVLRVALELRGSRTELDGPDPQFVEELHRRLAASAHDGGALLPLPTAGRRVPERGGATAWRYSWSRQNRPAPLRFGAIGKAAAAAVLIASSFTVTTLLGSRSPAPVAGRAPTAAVVHSGALLTSSGRPTGQMYAYNGNPSWVFIDVRGNGLNGVYTCLLQLANGTTVPAGLVTVYNGTGDWAHTVNVDASQLRRAMLVGPTGVTVASASFT